MPNSTQQNAFNGAQSTGKGVIYDALGNPVVIGAQMTAGASNGYVVQSDGSGNLSLGAVTAGAMPAATTTTQGAVILDGTAGDIQPVAAAAAAGSVGKAADAGHAHQFASGTSFTAVGFGLSNSSTAVTANQLYLATVYIPVACTLTGIAIENGATATGNVIVAIYNTAGSTQLAVSGSTAQSGPFHGQQIPFTGTLAATPGTYVFAATFSSSSATAAVAINVAPSSTGAQGGFSLPSTVTPPASMLVTSIPIMISY